MTKQEIQNVATIIQHAKLVMLLIDVKGEEQKVALGADVQNLIYEALKDYSYGHVG